MRGIKCILGVVFLFCGFAFGRSAVVINATAWWDFPSFPMDEYKITDYRYYIPPERVNFPTNLNG